MAVVIAGLADFRSVDAAQADDATIHGQGVAIDHPHGRYGRGDVVRLVGLSQRGGRREVCSQARNSGRVMDQFLQKAASSRASAVIYSNRQNHAKA